MVLSLQLRSAAAQRAADAGVQHHPLPLCRPATLARAQRQQHDAAEQQPGERQQAPPQGAAPMQVKRKFGQRRAKADPAGEGAATLPPDLLALVGGKRA